MKSCLSHAMQSLTITDKFSKISEMWKLLICVIFVLNASHFNTITANIDNVDENSKQETESANAASSEEAKEERKPNHKKLKASGVCKLPCARRKTGEWMLRCSRLQLRSYLLCDLCRRKICCGGKRGQESPL
ncbi:unnamed protein product [Clavelina lepadiformis]|uniref:Uncharacterized protein n=1 Tax=Clavelina lepadiformis TaxID=159417 RepID=A0ABP0F0L4_CLALP